MSKQGTHPPRDQRPSRASNRQPDRARNAAPAAAPERRPLNPLRFPNAVAALALAIVFLVHAALGTLQVSTPWRGALAWGVWVGIAIIAAHVVLSGATTWQMFFDESRPASPGKKRHQYLKIASGVAIAALAAAHVCGAPLAVGHTDSAGIATAAALAAAIVWHCFLGTKSLTHDLRLSAQLRTPFRIAVTAAFAAIALALMLAAGAL